MRQQNVKYFLMSFLAVLFVGIGFWGCAVFRTPDSGPPAKNETAAPISSIIPVRGAITHLHESDKQSYTVMDIVIGEHFEGTLPDDIDSITVKSIFMAPTAIICTPSSRTPKALSPF